MNGARKHQFQASCDGEDCPFAGEYHVYDRHNRQVGNAWCEGCADQKIATLDAYDPPTPKGNGDRNAETP